MSEPCSVFTETWSVKFPTSGNVFGYRNYEKPRQQQPTIGLVALISHGEGWTTSPTPPPRRSRTDTNGTSFSNLFMGRGPIFRMIGLAKKT